MASNTSPVFVKTPILGCVAITAATAAKDGTGPVFDIVSAAPTEGTKIEEIIVKTTGDPADSVIIIFVHTGSIYVPWDEFDIGNPAAGSTTVAGYRESRLYDNLVLPSGYKLCASLTVAMTAGTPYVIAAGGTLTA